MASVDKELQPAYDTPKVYRDTRYYELLERIAKALEDIANDTTRIGSGYRGRGGGHP